MTFILPVVSDVSGDMNVHGNLVGLAGEPGRMEIESLRAALARLPLRPERRAELVSLTDEAATALHAAPEEPARAAHALRRLVARLRAGGELAAGGEAVMRPLLRLVALLGTAGAAVRELMAD
jgi:hypothetical protein